MLHIRPPDDKGIKEAFSVVWWDGLEVCNSFSNDIFQTNVGFFLFRFSILNGAFCKLYSCLDLLCMAHCTA